MPIEIKELHIKAIISEEKSPIQSQWISQEDVTKLKKEITKEVAEKVMRMLQQKNER